MNLFLSTRRSTTSEENHLTEFIAAALEVDDDLRRAYASVVLQDYAERQGWGVVEIAECGTQKNFRDTSCCPDLVLNLRDGHVIICEHKIDAPETLALNETDSGSDEPIRQLKRYLRLSVDGVAYFRSSWRPPAAEILAHPKYVKPANREHFLWSDLYEPLQQGTSDVARWLREGFEHLGYTPPHPAIGNLDDPDEVLRRSNRQNLAKLWNLTRSSLREAGWKVDAGATCELYLRSNSQSAAELIWVAPRREMLWVRITPRDPSTLDEIHERVSAAAAALKPQVEVSTAAIRRGDGHRGVVDAAIPLRTLLKEMETSLEIEQRLRSYIVPLVRAVEAARIPQ